MTGGEEQRDDRRVRESGWRRIRIGRERSGGDIQLRPYRDMSGYDHELPLSLTPVKFIYKPFEAFLVQTTSRVRAGRGVRIQLARVVEHYDLERHACLGLEGVGGEVIIEIRLRESVALRV